MSRSIRIGIAIVAYAISVATFFAIASAVGAMIIVSFHLAVGLPFALGAYIATAPSDERESLFRKNITWVPLTVGIVGFFYFSNYISTFDSVGVDFYASVAQVIPVLALALIVDARTVSIVPNGVLALVMTVGLVGEGFALGNAAAPERSSTVNFAITAAAVLTLGVALIMIVGSRTTTAMSVDSLDRSSESVESSNCVAQRIECRGDGGQKSSIGETRSAEIITLAVAMTAMAVALSSVRRR